MGIVNRTLIKHGLTAKLSQVPVVSFPVDLSCGDEHPGQLTTKRSIAIRTFITNDFMTGVPAEPGSDYMPLEVLQEMVEGIEKVPGISRVVYDLTSKPPGTTEWEGRSGTPAVHKVVLEPLHLETLACQLAVFADVARL